MANVTIYSTSVCPYCVRAKRLLDDKKVAYTEVDVSSPAERDKMIQKTGGKRSVPQIFIGDVHIGGCDDLYALNQQGKLDVLLSMK